jgi:dihydrofolate reductase
VAQLIYSMLTSFDGYVADEHGDFTWAEPDVAVHAHVNDAERAIGTCLYGRRMYEVMRVWETYGTEPDASEVERDFAMLWRATDKVVFSRTLPEVTTTRTRLVREFDAAEVRAMKEAADRDLSVSGPGIAARALAAGLVDEVRMYLNPVVVGAGTAALPDGLRVGLRLLEERSFANGAVYLRYAVTD